MKTAIAALAALLVATFAQAQDFPARPVHLVVPYTPGTGADILARLLGPKLAARWKVSVVTENKPGATGVIGTEHVAKSAPDGHTLLVVATSFGTTPALRPLPFDPVKSFAPVALVATSGMMVVVHPELPAGNIRELIELARRQPGKLHYSSPGNGGPQHMAMELLKLETGIDLVHVPYKGAAGAMQDVVGGHVQATVAAVQTAYPAVQSGKLRALGLMSAERSPAYPDVPTLKEQGFANLEVETWYGVFAPAGTPAAAIQRINADIDQALKEADAVVVGENLPRAVGRSIYLEQNARMQMQALLLAGPDGKGHLPRCGRAQASVARQDYYRAWPLWRDKALAKLR